VLSSELVLLYYVIKHRGCRFENDVCYTGFSSHQFLSEIKRLALDFKFLNVALLTTE
jgi:hypothetical protein